MASSWFGKKDQSGADPPEKSSNSGGDHPSELGELTSHLDRLGELLGQAKDRIATYLIRRESQTPAPPAEQAGDAIRDEPGLTALLEAFGEILDQIEARLNRLSEGSAGGVVAQAPAGAPLAEILSGIHRQSGEVAEALHQLRGQVDSGMQRLADLLSPENVAEAAPAAGIAEWEQTILGQDLAQDPALAFQRQQLIGGVLEGNPAACSLAGQLLVFRSAPAERLPQLLKDLGEAYYRWQPKTASGITPIEEALVGWLRRSCEAAGIFNTIELVHPGERFDATRHTAASRGVEITEVRGWIVLRDNGKVYTKANVAVH